jgi:hypothetical protein
MMQNNMPGPNSLLADYKKYEYVMNVDKKFLIEDLFKGGEEGRKRTLEEIRA